MRWLRVKRCVQGRVTPHNISGSERSKFASLTAEYQLWNLFQKKRCLCAANKQMMYILTIRGTERVGRGGNLFHFV